ncbi:MAG: type III polyketide synthase, partial [Cypionkella sp.]
REAPELALRAIAGLPALGAPTHLVVASCTGFVAPGIDQIIARRLGLAGDVERVLIGFMGCYAAVTALRTARHIVRSQPDARVLVVTVELSSLHHQEEMDLEPLLMGAQFGDGAAAAIVTDGEPGLELGEGISAALEDSAELITWRIGDTGFHMRLSGEVPGRIAAARADPAVQARITGGVPAEQIEAWAVHAGGRSILGAVEKGLHLSPTALDDSREVLRTCGNMSSSTLMFALKRILRHRPASGVALAFGPGLAIEGFGFGWRDAR